MLVNYFNTHTNTNVSIMTFFFGETLFFFPSSSSASLPASKDLIHNQISVARASFKCHTHRPQDEIPEAQQSRRTLTQSEVRFLCSALSEELSCTLEPDGRLKARLK